MPEYKDEYWRRIEALEKRVRFLEEREAIRLGSRSPSPYDLSNSGFVKKKVK